MIPGRLGYHIDNMLAGDFLYRYRSIEGLLRSYEYMDKRTRFASNFTKAVDTYLGAKEEIDQLFMDFFPDLIAYVKEVYEESN